MTNFAFVQTDFPMEGTRQDTWTTKTSSGVFFHSECNLIYISNYMKNAFNRVKCYTPLYY